MTQTTTYQINPDLLAAFEKALPKQGLFLIDDVPNRDLKVVSRSRDDDIEFTLIRTHRKSQWKPDFKIFIEGARWGSLNGRLFDELPDLVAALRKRGLQYVEFEFS